MVNIQDIITRYEQGESLRNMGELYGVSRQRIWQLLKRNYSKIKHPRPHKKYTILANTPSEEHIIVKLTKQGFEVKPQPYNHYFDLLVNNKKVEVKYDSKPQIIGKTYYYKFAETATPKPVDYFIFICGELGKETCYILPSAAVKNWMVFSVAPTYRASKEKKRLYENNWDLLKLDKVL